MKVVVSLISVLLVAGLLVTSPGCKKGKKSDQAPTTKTALVTKAQTTCPIDDEQIDKDIYGDYEGKRVYFCCSDCRDVFNDDPTSYVQEIEDDGVVLEKVPK